MPAAAKKKTRSFADFKKSAAAWRKINHSEAIISDENAPDNESISFSWLTPPAHEVTKLGELHDKTELDALSGADAVAAVDHNFRLMGHFLSIALCTPQGELEYTDYAQLCEEGFSDIAQMPIWSAIFGEIMEQIEDAKKKPAAKK